MILLNVIVINIQVIDVLLMVNLVFVRDILEVFYYKFYICKYL